MFMSWGAIDGNVSRALSMVARQVEVPDATFNRQSKHFIEAASLNPFVGERISSLVIVTALVCLGGMEPLEIELGRHASLTRQKSAVPFK